MHGAPVSYYNVRLLYYNYLQLQIRRRSEPSVSKKIYAASVLQQETARRMCDGLKGGR